MATLVKQDEYEIHFHVIRNGKMYENHKYADGDNWRFEAMEAVDSIAHAIENDQNALKRCPHCGGEARCYPIDCGQHSREDGSVYWRTDYEMRCTECGSTGPRCQSTQEAIEAWNRRV